MGSEAYSELWQTSKMERFVSFLFVVNYFHKTFRFRCLIGFWVGLWKSKTFMFITNLICNKLTECINVISKDDDRKFDANANLSLIFLYFLYYRDKNIHVVRNCLNWNFTRKEWLHVFNYHCSLLVNGEKSTMFTHIWLWSAKLGS